MEPLGEEGKQTHLIILGLHNQVDSTLKTKTFMSLRESVTTRLYKAPNAKINVLFWWEEEPCQVRDLEGVDNKKLK
jgi:hypothetical protein